jgi:hypothetical protein
VANQRDNSLYPQRRSSSRLLRKAVIVLAIKRKDTMFVKLQKSEANCHRRYYLTAGADPIGRFGFVVCFCMTSTTASRLDWAKSAAVLS